MCRHGSVLNIESSNLTSIHFKTSIQRRRDREVGNVRRAFSSLLVLSDLSFYILCFLRHILSYDRNLVCPSQAAFGSPRSKSATAAGDRGWFRTTNFSCLVNFRRQVQNCTVEKPYDQRRCSFNHSLTWSSLSLSPLSPSLNMEVIFLQPCWPSLSPLHSTLEDRSDAKRCTDSSMTSLLEFIHHLFWIFISNTHSYTLSWTVGQARRRKEGGERL